MPHGVDGPGVLDHEKRNPLPFVDVNEVPGTRDYGDGINNEKRCIELKFVTGSFSVVGDIAEKSFRVELHDTAYRA